MSCSVTGVWRMLLAMATLDMKIRAEVRMRELLDQEGLPAPDIVEYGNGCVRLYFKDTRTVIVVDIDEDGLDAEDDGTGEDELGPTPPT